MKYTCNTPCNNCPYRKDAPKKLWDKEEFKDLLKSESDYIGKVYGCHKKNGTICRGWLMMQDKNYFPSIALRISLSKNNITRVYLDSLHCASKMYRTTLSMIRANYPALLKK